MTGLRPTLCQRTLSGQTTNNVPNLGQCLTLGGREAPSLGEGHTLSRSIGTSKDV